MPKALRHRPLCNKKCQKVRDNYLKAKTLPQSCLRVALADTVSKQVSRDSPRQTVVHINYTKQDLMYKINHKIRSDYCTKTKNLLK